MQLYCNNRSHHDERWDEEGADDHSQWSTSDRTPDHVTKALIFRHPKPRGKPGQDAHDKHDSSTDCGRVFWSGRKPSASQRPDCHLQAKDEVDVSDYEDFCPNC